MPEINLTWNLFFSVLAVPILGWYLRRLISHADKASEERHQSIIEHFKKNDDDHKEMFGVLTDHAERISYLEGISNGRDRESRKGLPI